MEVVRARGRKLGKNQLRSGARRHRARRAGDSGPWRAARSSSFSIAPGHDSSVVGDEPYVSLHILGAEDYAHK
jgi:hypothetical protein